ncbi:MAG: LysR family transcriptional regulator [Anderseniella sp.]|nr:LysR family transcriptional regulator [Anderseniella sp.]
MPLSTRNNNFDWDKLRIFHAVAEAGSFTHAGHDLGLSQSAVSRQISALESDLAVALFHRHARGLILTEQGEMLYRTAHDVFTKLANARARLTDSRDKPSGDLRVSTTVGLGTIWLTPRLREFTELFPQIKVELLLTDEELDLSMREADVAIRLRRPTQGDLIQRKLFTVHNHAYASPEYVQENGLPQSLEELDKHKILAFGPVPSFLDDLSWLEKIGREAGDPRPSTFRINSIYGLRRAVESGLGIAVLPDYIVGDESSLIRVPLDEEGPAIDTYFVYPEEMRNSKRIAVFRDFVVSKARQWKF